MAKKEKVAYEELKIYELGLDMIKPDPSNPRGQIDESELTELAESIKEYGLKYPIIFKEINDSLIIVDGERRYRAAKQAGLKKIPAMLESKNPEIVAILANLHRQAYTPVAEAEAIKGLMEIPSFKGATHAQLGKVVGKAESTIEGILKIAELPASIRDEIRNSSQYAQRELTKIARLKTEGQQKAAFKRYKDKVAKGDQERNDKGSRRNKVNAATNALTSFKNSLKNVQKHWNDSKIWDGRQKTTLKSKLEELKKQIDELLDE